jgi:hypothetical protein
MQLHSFAYSTSFGAKNIRHQDEYITQGSYLLEKSDLSHSQENLNS